MDDLPVPIQEPLPLARLPLSLPPKENGPSSLVHPLGEGKDRQEEWLLISPCGRSRWYLSGKALRLFRKALEGGEAALDRESRYFLKELGLLPAPVWAKSIPPVQNTPSPIARFKYLNGKPA